jgi:hypothetical protein
MALVSYIIGACPSCGAPESYGNVMVGGNTLSRGCLQCKHWDSIPLPELQKKVIYLDQFFFSHAFRGEHRMFVEARKRITDLALAQQIVVPYSNLHEDESELWTEAQRAPLLKFIKQTSLGHKFSYEYEVKNRQIHRAFQTFLASGPTAHTVERSDALERDVNEWDGYIWVDVGNFLDKHDDLKMRKDRSMEDLLDAFDAWATSPSTFKEDVQFELRSSAKSYIEHYVDYVKRIVSRDPTAFLTANENSMMIESLLRYQDKLPASLRMQRIQAFFQSDYFANVPEARIGSEFFALLRHRLRQGEYKNKEKNRDRFGGLFYDIRFISTYAPYCDAMVVDNLMFQWATDSLIDLPKRFGVRLFSRRNWDDFLTYLADLAASQRPEVEDALKMIRPAGARTPEWIRRGSALVPNTDGGTEKET